MSISAGRQAQRHHPSARAATPTARTSTSRILPLRTEAATHRRGIHRHFKHDHKVALYVDVLLLVPTPPPTPTPPPSFCFIYSFHASHFLPSCLLSFLPFSFVTDLIIVFYYIYYFIVGRGHPVVFEV